MPHLISESEVDRLSKLCGITQFDEWKKQLDNIDVRIPNQLKHSVGDAWHACLPTWIEFGRVNDFSRAVRTPNYWPSYANRLGQAFADRYRDDYQFLIDTLHAMPPDSYEYLCAYDLLEMIVSELHILDLPVPAQLYAIELPVPPVVRVETNCDDRYHDLSTIGEFLYRTGLIAIGDDDA